MKRPLFVAGVLALAAGWALAAEVTLEQRVNGLISASGAEVGVAFRTVDGTQELLINAKESFHAASTMKVPVMIEMFRQARLGFFELDDGVPVTNRFRSIAGDGFFALSAHDDSETELYKAIGQTRTYRELCEAMITWSSNLATNILVERLGVERIQQTAIALGALGTNVRRGVEDEQAFRLGLNNTTSAGALLTLMQAIAVGRAVSPEDSRAMVEILERQHFNDAIPAGLSPGTRVAHKTGSMTRIQHDAAIVYGPRPYVLVVLVRGIEDEKASKTLIAEITRAINASVH